MILTEDDVAILRHVARHRFLRSTHVAGLLAHRSEKKMTERLAVLYHNGYLDRPRAQLDYYATTGSQPMVYALGNRGAGLLGKVDDIERVKVDWTDKNRTVRRPFLEHTLLIADLMVALEVAVRANAGVRLIAARDILAVVPKSTRAKPNPFALQIDRQHAGKAANLSVIPDAVFGLDGIGRGLKYFFLEADRATMPVMRKSLAQTSMFRKFLAYAAGGGAANLFGHHLGLPNFRVLTITTTRERTRSMIAALQAATAGRGLRQFLFTDCSMLANAHDALALPWTNGKGECVRLAD